MEEKNDNLIVIESEIQYRIEIDKESSQWHIKYKNSFENDLVAVKIAQFVTEHAVASLSTQKKDLPNKVKAKVNKRIEKYAAARFGLNLLFDQLQGIYEEQVLTKTKDQNEVHQDQEQWGDSAAGDSPVGSEFQEERPH